MRRLRALLWLCVFLTACGTERTEIYFFYDALCPGCEDWQRAEAIEARLKRLDREQGSYRVQSHNVAVADGEDVLTARLEERGLGEISRSLPILLVGEHYFVGHEDIEREVLRLSETDE